MMHEDVKRVIRAYHEGDDALGSYTGMTQIGTRPVQDADDL